MTINRSYNLIKNSWKENDPASIMFHTTFGTSVIGAVETLRKRGLSYNYLISEGKVYELVPYTHSAWHAGITKGMTLKTSVFYKGDNPNKHSVGIAFVRPQGIWSLSEADVDAAVQLIKYIGQKTGVRYTTLNIFHHREITFYKPLEVKYYTEQVLKVLIGDKDSKDDLRITILRLTLQLLKLKLQLLWKMMK